MPKNMPTKKITQLIKILFLFFLFGCVSDAEARGTSIYQTDRFDFTYCSDVPCISGGGGDNFCGDSKYTCNETRKGFRAQFEPSQKVMCGIGEGCVFPDDGEWTIYGVSLSRTTPITASILPNSFQFFIPPGTNSIAYQSVIAPTSGTDFVVVGIINKESMNCPYSYPPTDSLAGAPARLEEVLQHCVYRTISDDEILFLLTSGGHNISKGEWLQVYVNVVLSSISIPITFDIKTYKKWYNCMNEKNGWDEDGDPKYNFTACDNLSTSPSPSPSPTTSPSPSPTTSPTPTQFPPEYCSKDSFAKVTLVGMEKNISLEKKLKTVPPSQ
jgi:hypothetical protein